MVLNTLFSIAQVYNNNKNIKDWLRNQTKKSLVRKKIFKVL